MAQKILAEDGVTEVEVYTVDEMKAQIETAVKAKETEFGKTKEQIEKELGETKKALHERTGEFKQFRKLNDDTVAKLTVAERTIYENSLRLEEANQAREKSEADNKEKTIDSIIRGKVGTDEKVITKVKEMYKIIGLNDGSPQEIEARTLAAIGALGTTTPDLVTGIISFNGSYAPPTTKKDGEASFADSERGKKGANELGLILETPAKK